MTREFITAECPLCHGRHVVCREMAHAPAEVDRQKRHNELLTESKRQLNRRLKQVQRACEGFERRNKALERVVAAARAFDDKFDPWCTCEPITRDSHCPACDLAEALDSIPPVSKADQGPDHSGAIEQSASSPAFHAENPGSNPGGVTSQTGVALSMPLPHNPDADGIEVLCYCDACHLAAEPAATPEPRCEVTNIDSGKRCTKPAGHSSWHAMDDGTFLATKAQLDAAPAPPEEPRTGELLRCEGCGRRLPTMHAFRGKQVCRVCQFRMEQAAPPSVSPEARPGPWRVGRKLGRTLYCAEQLVGMLDDPYTAQHIVDVMNRDEAAAGYVSKADYDAAIEERNRFNIKAGCYSAELDDLRLKLRRLVEEWRRPLHYKSAWRSYPAQKVLGLCADELERALIRDQGEGE